MRRQSRHALFGAVVSAIVIFGVHMPFEPQSPTDASLDPAQTASTAPWPLYAITQSRVPVGCSDLVPRTALSAAMGVPGPDIHTVEPQDIDLWTAAEMQAGTLSCSWEGPPRGWTTDDQPREIRPASLWLTVVPDAGPEFHTYSQYINPPSWSDDDFLVIGDVIGPDSWAYCSTDATDRTCQLSFETNGYWVDVLFDGPRAEGSPEQHTPSPAIAFGEAIAAVLGEVGDPDAASAIPSDALMPWESCDSLDADGALRNIVGSPNLPESPDYEEYASIPPDEFATALERVNFGQCGWNEPQEYYPDGPLPSFAYDEIRQMSVSVLPGGEWAWHATTERAFAIAERGDNSLVSTRVLLDGVDAVIVCFAGFVCDAAALVDHSLISVSFQYQSWGDEIIGNEAAMAQGFQFLPALIEHIRSHQEAR